MEFRRDLLAHLNTLIVRIPPLRDYAEDVPELLRHYVDRAVDAEGLPFRRFSVAAQNRLRNYPWPDNVRELQEPGAAPADPGRPRGDPARGNRARAGHADRRPASRWSSRTCWRCRCARRASSSSAPTCSSSCCCATARWGSWPSVSAWSARTCIASCARSGVGFSRHAADATCSSRAPVEASGPQVARPGSPERRRRPPAVDGAPCSIAADR